MKKWKKALLIVVCVIGVLALMAGIVAGSCALFGLAVEDDFTFTAYDGSKGGDRIHFLNVGNSDAILLESCGKFALIDCGEDNDNPRGLSSLDLTGYEDYVGDYLNSFCAGEDGQIYLEFIIGTHAHSDHLGGFDTVLAQDNVHLERAYLKRYSEEGIKKAEVSGWDNKEVYEQTVAAVEAQGAELVQDLEDLSFAFGNFSITLFNGQEADPDDKVGENENSLGVLVEKDGYRVFLAGDINNFDGDEKRLAPEIGKVNVLKLGHHGYLGSSTLSYIRTLDPDMAIQTNNKPANLSVQIVVTMINMTPIYQTAKHNGIILDITDVGDVRLYDKIDLGETTE